MISSNGPLVPQSRKQYLQFGIILLCIICVLPTRLFWKSHKWRFPSLYQQPPQDHTTHSRHAINTTAECRYFPEALAQLVHDLQNRPEQFALRDWSLAILGALEPQLTPEQEEWGNRSVSDFKDFLRHIIEDRRAPFAAGRFHVRRE